MILVGDVGATKVRLALFDQIAGRLERQEIAEFPSSDFAGLEEIAKSFLDARSVAVQSACFGVPGPVLNGEAKATNLPWRLKETKIARVTGLDNVKLVNDLVATTAAVPYLAKGDLLVLHRGEKASPRATCGVLAPGTGLGQGFLYFDNGECHVHPSEGGHADFAPNTELEVDLLRFLRTRFTHVSYERVLSGPGLVNIYEFLRDSVGVKEPPVLARRFESADAAAVISETGQSGEFEISVKALHLFVSILGAQAGNLVLTLLATGGIYLGGGIPPKILSKLGDGTIVRAYLSKGRLWHLVEKTSLYVIRDDRAALLGAAHFASKLS